MHHHCKSPINSGVWRNGASLPHDLFRLCLSAELCSKSQTKRRDETLAMCLPSVQEGQTWWERMKKRDFFTLYKGKGEGRLRIYGQTLHIIYQRTVKHWCTLVVASLRIVGFMSSLYSKCLQVREELILETTDVTARNRILAPPHDNLCTAEDYVA